MIADEQNRTVTRLRHELGAVGVRAHTDQVDRMLRRVHTRRREQRQHRIQMVAALAVVLIAVAGAFVVSWRQAEPDQIVAADLVVNWPLRGDLATDTDLLQRAEQAWRGGPTPPTGPVHPVYAGKRVSRTASLVVVALVSPVDRVHSRVAFVTSKISTDQNVDSARLSVRATTLIGRGQRAIGFLNATVNSDDDELRGGGGLGFILAEPGVTEVKYRSSAEDDAMAETPPLAPDGVAWFEAHSGIAAWNTVIEVPGTPMTTVNFAAGVYEANIIPVSLSTVGNTVKVGGDVQDGDLIVTVNGLVGVITGTDGTVDTRLSEFYRVGDLQTALTKHPVRLVERDGATHFELSGPGEVRPTNRIVLVDGDLKVEVAKVAADGSRVERTVDPTTTVVAMRVRNR
ncbi:hypothetical protein [Alloactinosynnema sp. L-07]|uniref:hypothetical protein n=1 Tax=Alloactinosynnema sp. L-07 TaxID=1653480 RepID=UPI00065F03AC|nr:hypothetical protein [Alloactinosynnema sp. L-07]CRK60096.1 hypothetical protein [Alloactinosynnema sp. L-07]